MIDHSVIDSGEPYFRAEDIVIDEDWEPLLPEYTGPWYDAEAHHLIAAANSNATWWMQ